MSIYLIKQRIITILKKIICYVIFKIKKFSNDDYDVQKHILVNMSHSLLKRPYRDGEIIDMVFLFQAASFWPSWESLWEECLADSRINPMMVVCDYDFKEKSQFKSAQTFLNNKNIKYHHISDFNISSVRPHVFVLQTPYDGHRPRYLHSDMLSSKGNRLVYITYGIEISDTDRARSDHFMGGVTTNAWRVYTFSENMIEGYKYYSPTGGDMVRSLGHPKFDLLDKKYFPELPPEIKERAAGRPVVLWKVHFPKEVNGDLITPSIDIYIELLNDISNYKNIYFIFMPHPKFYEKLAEFSNVGAFKKKIEKLENVYQYFDDDYRPVLLNSDYYILDRSALMVEAGVTGRPILFLNASKSEVMTQPVKSIVDTYYQAQSYKEIKHFIDQIVLLDSDPLKEKRLKAFSSVLKNTDGMSGHRIKEDIVNSLKDEITI